MPLWLCQGGEGAWPDSPPPLNPPLGLASCLHSVLELLNNVELCPSNYLLAYSTWSVLSDTHLGFSRDLEGWIFDLDLWCSLCECVAVSGGQLGYPCLPGDSCADSNAVCVLGVCLCHDNFFEKNTRCCKQFYLISSWCRHYTDLTAALRRLTENIIRNEKRWRLIYTGGLFREMHEF